MNNTYNGNIYLTRNDLNSIEYEIGLLTEQIQENIFNNQTSSLQNIQVGDNLDSKILYLDIPTDFYNTYDGVRFIDVATTDKNNTIYLMYTRLDPAGEDVRQITRIQVKYRKKGSTIYNTYNLYSYIDNITTNKTTLETNKKRFKLPSDFGTITSINTNNNAYQYIKIYNDTMIIPDYEPYIWEDDEFLSMQKIDNIEQGIKNIGDYYYKPTGWINVREWLKTSTIDNMYDDMNMQNISYMDLNRWMSNLNLINFDNLNELTIWNSTISEINWNEENDTEWEEV